MKLDPPRNGNYAAVVIRINHVVDLPGLDMLVGVPALGHQALTTKGVQVGDLMIAFTAETALSEEYASRNNLYRKAAHNADPDVTGYLEDKARIRALKLRGHRSDALLMPLSSVEYTGVDWLQFEEGDTFDTLDGHEICRKYEIPRKPVNNPAKSKVDKAFKRVDKKVFPEHLDTDQYHRSKFLIRGDREVVITQKLHGTSWRGGNVPVLRKLKWYEKLLTKVGVKIPDWEYATVFGSRKVIKDPTNPNQEHFYESDIWTGYGIAIADLIPEGYLVYGELVGWTPDGAPIQKNYTYDVPAGACTLYVYRVATINRAGVLSDLPWDGVKDFCRERGLAWVPELERVGGGFNTHELIEDIIEETLDTVLSKREWAEEPLPLSDKKTVDEGICLRVEGQVPTVLKCKSPKFLEHETKLLDKGEADIESAA